MTQRDVRNTGAANDPPSIRAESIWDAILPIARWTPSPHNTQPWKVRVIDGSRATLLLDHARALPKEDLTGCFIECAMGSFIESLRLLAANRGVRLDAAPLVEPRRADLEPFAELRLEEDSTVAAEYEDELFARRQTSRLAPAAETLSDDERERLEQAARTGGLRWHHYTDPKVIDRLMDLNLEAVIADLNHRDYHDEIVSWFRYRESAARRRADGLSARCMVMPPHELYLFGRCPWSARLPLVGRVVRRLYRHRLGPVPQLAALSGPFWDRPAATAAGAALLRLWLELTRMGLFIHPFGNLVTNDTARRGLRDVTGDEDIWLVFRLGRTVPPPRSHRLGVETITDV